MKFWKYCDKVEFIWNGSMSDPELKYDEITMSYYDVHDIIFNDFDNYIKEHNLNLDPEKDEDFLKYCLENESFILDIFYDYYHGVVE